jgi:hypothetical protein
LGRFEIVISLNGFVFLRSIYGCCIGFRFIRKGGRAFYVLYNDNYILFENFEDLIPIFMVLVWESEKENKFI